jgi:hypothetical protein
MKTGLARHCACLLQFVLIGFFASRLFASGGGVITYYPQFYPVGLTLACNQVDETPPAVSHAFSSPPDGLSIYTIQADGFVADNYLGGWTDPNLLLPLGDAWFLRNPLTPFTVTFVGYVNEGTNQLSAGWNACGAILPQSGRVSTDLGCPVVSNDVVYVFNITNQAYESYSFTTNWQPSEPVMVFGQGFWIQKSSPSEWTKLLGFGLVIENSHTVISSTVGQVNFFTYNPLNASFGQVFQASGPLPVGVNYVGQLYAGLTSQESSLNPIGTPIRFACGTAAGYIRGSTVFVPGTTGNQTVYLQLRVWDDSQASDFETATAIGASQGKSTVFATQTGATIVNGHPGLPPVRSDGFPSFAVQGLPSQRALVATSIQISNGVTVITYSGTPYQTYIIESATNLNQPTWIPISTNAANSCATLEAVDPAASPSSQKYYRGRSDN